MCKKTPEEIKEGIKLSKAYVISLNESKQPLFDFYYCWDRTKHGIDNEDCLEVKIVKIGYSPKNLKDLIFLPVL